MKTLLYISTVACVVFGLYSCDKDDDGHIANQQVKNALKTRYPSADHISWEMKNGYIVADFKAPAPQNPSGKDVEYSAWFDRNGTWYMTETDIPFALLPDAIKATFQQSEYARWIIDDVDMIEREKLETVYVIEVEGFDAGRETEVGLYYSTDGILIKKLIDIDNDYDYGDFIPPTLSGNIEYYIDTHYPGARILEIDKENGTTEIEIIDGTVCRDLLFDRTDNWIQTKTETAYRDIPAIIQQAIANSIYASYRIDDIYHIETSTAEYFYIEFEDNGREEKVRIDMQGNFF